MCYHVVLKLSGGNMNNWQTLASEASINNVISSLVSHGINVEVVPDAVTALARVEAMIPTQAEVMNMTSVTLDTIGVADLINESGKYQSVKNKLKTMDRQTDGSQMNKLGAAPDYAVGSVHAITEDGQVVIASNTGSQLPAYAYGSAHVIWVAGTQKIVKDLTEAMQRINEYVLPLEAERARKAYGSAGSNVSKLLIFSKEVTPNRITLILVKEVLGF
jgi:hypothetical protein